MAGPVLIFDHLTSCIYYIRIFILVIDPCKSSNPLLTSRFNEWGRAAWELQLKKLTEPNVLDWRFISFVMGDDDPDGKMRDSIEHHISGRITSALTLRRSVYAHTH